MSLVTPAAAAGLPAVLQATDFGVVANSKRDSSAQIQKAIDTATSNGANLSFPPGQYLCKGVRIKKPIRLAGVRGETMLVSPDGSAIFAMENVANITLDGLGFDGAGHMAPGDDKSGALLEAQDCERLVIEACSFIGSMTSGLSLTRCSGRIANNRVGFAEITGIFAMDSKGLEISGNHVHDIGNNGIQVWRSDKGEDGSIVSGNRVERVAARSGGTGQNGNGINVYKAANVIVANNRVTDCRFSAVRNNSGSNCQIIGNNISRTDEVAIFVEFAFDGAVVSNNLIEQPALGISITNLDQGGRLAVVANNIIRDVRGPIALAETSGTGIGAEADTVVTGNIVENAPDTGIHLGWGPYSRNLSAIGNTVRNCGIGISASLFEGAQAVVIANNIIAGAKQAAILGMDHDKPVTKDLMESEAEVPERIKLSGNLVS